jgi:hypothetical protein
VTSAAYVVARARRLMSGGRRDIYNRLSAALDPDGDTVSLDFDASRFTEGAVFEIGAEVMRVLHRVGNTLTVERSSLGTANDAHATGAAVTLNPEVLTADLFDGINDELRDLSSPLNGLFRVETVDLTVTTDYSYNLPTVEAPLGIAGVKYREVGQPVEWLPVHGWKLATLMATSDFASGSALTFGRDMPLAGRPVRVWARTGFALLGSLDDDVEDASGLHSEAVDILWLGAAIRAAAGREIARNLSDAQGDTRRATEVPAGANNAAPAALRLLRAQRIRSEAARLQRIWGV